MRPRGLSLLPLYSLRHAAGRSSAQPARHRVPRRSLRRTVVMPALIGLTALMLVFEMSSQGGACMASSQSPGGRLSQLPFDIPSRATLAASPKQVVAYYHSLPLYGRSNDKYADALSPRGRGGADYSSGGRGRQRPYPAVDDAQLTDARRQQYMYDDISDAAAIGIDAFFFNVTYTPTDSFRWK